MEMGENAIAKMPSGAEYSRRMVKKKEYTVKPSEYIMARYKKPAKE